MPLRRRDMLAGAALGLPLLPRPVRAADFPAHDISFLIPYAPGGGFDAVVRQLIPPMQAALGGPGKIVPVNLEGAGGAEAANKVYRARPDGYTIAAVNVPGILILHHQGGLAFDPGQLSWVCNVGMDSYALAVAENGPLRSLDDLRSLGSTRAVRFPCVGPAGTAYSATRIASDILGIRSQVIGGYKGTSDYILAMIRGDGEAVVASVPALEQFRTGKLVRVLATFEVHGSTPGALDATELGHPELAQIKVLRSIAAPPHLPAALGTQLADALLTAVRDPQVVAWAQANQLRQSTDGPEATRRLFQEQAAFIERWKRYLAPA